MKDSLLIFPSKKTDSEFSLAGKISLLLGVVLLLIFYLSPDGWWTDIVIIPAHLLPLAGIRILGFYYQVRIDSDKNSVEVAKGFLIPMFFRNFHRSDFTKVGIIRSAVSSNRASINTVDPLTSIYKLALIGKKTIILETTHDRAQILKGLSQLAEALELPVEDKA